VSIHILAPQVRNRIAAGEVIERPASVVKELIENAVDAGATKVSIEVRDGGLGLIRVSDDGCGMNREDVQLAVERFSTSKIETIEDLSGIRTLGFRGEALCSMASVAQVEILTRTANELEGTRLSADQDSVRPEPAASPAGASVTVRGLLQHFPGRRRFLKSRMRESEWIQRTTVSYALAYPQIAFRLIIDGRERLVAPPGTLLARIGAVLGHDVAQEMVPLEWRAVDMRVLGYCSRPTLLRARRDAQHVAVNGRPIRPGLIAVMLERPYAGRVPAGRHPIAVLHLELDPRQVDVNVHPRKSEVRYAHERTVYHAVTRAVEDALSGYPRNQQEGLSWPFAGGAQFSESWGSALAEEQAPYLTSASGMRALAQLHYTYILAQTPDGLAIADQHAAHEQVLYEQLSRGPTPVPLSPPPRFELPPREMDTLERIGPTLSGLGLEIEAFGSRSFIVRAIPQPVQGHDPVELVTTLIQEAARMRSSEQELRERLATRMACLGAIKAGDPISLERAQTLLDDLAQAWSPATCPHGRPALIAISLEELARRFGR
jgi:DNA mismatch repair protein MutL